MRKSLIKNKNIILLWAGILIYTVIFTVLKILQHRSLFAFSGEDVATFNQLAYNTAMGRFFYVSIWDTIFRMHLELIYLFVAPLYRVFPHIYNLFFLWSFSFALGGIAVYKIGERLFKNQTIALAFAYSYLLFPPLHFLNFVDFRPMMFSVPLLFFTFYFYLKERFWLFIFFSLLVMSCREDLGIVIAMFSFLAIAQKRSLSWKLFPFILGVSWFVLTVRIILPALGYRRYEPLWKYMGGGNYSFWEFFNAIISSPAKTLKVMFTSDHILYLLRIFNPPAYLLAVFSPGVLFLSLPTFLAIMLQYENSQLHFQSSHYICAIVVFSFLATMCTYKKIFSEIEKLSWGSFTKENAKKLLIALLLAWTFFANFGDNMVSDFNFEEGYDVKDHRFLYVRNIYNPVFYVMDDDDRQAWQLIRKIPHNASVATSGDLLPALSNRKKLYEFALGKFGDRDFFYSVPEDWGYDAEYILVHKRSIYFGASINEVVNDLAYPEAIRLIKGKQYELLQETPSFLLLKKYKGTISHG